MFLAIAMNLLAITFVALVSIISLSTILPTSFLGNPSKSTDDEGLPIFFIGSSYAKSITNEGPLTTFSSSSGKTSSRSLVVDKILSVLSTTSAINYHMSCK